MGKLILALVLCLSGCLTPRYESGLFQGPLPMATLARDGDIGIDTFGFLTWQARLPSGLRIAVEQAPTRGMVGVVLTVGAGSMRDPTGKEGLAHYVEHLGFRARFGGGPAVSVRLTAAGAMYNAATTLDDTTYYEFAPEAALPDLLQLAAQRLAAPMEGVEESPAAVELAIVRNELRQRNETGVYGQVAGWLNAALFPPDHAYARAVAGSHESLDRLTLADARAFVQQHYKAANITMLVIGDFNDAKVNALMAALPPALFGDRAKPIDPTPSPILKMPAMPPAAPAGGVHRHETSVSHPEIWIGWTLPSAYGIAGPQVKLTTTSIVEETLKHALRKVDAVTSVSTLPFRSRFATVYACQIVLSDPALRDKVKDLAIKVLSQLWLSSGGVPGHARPNQIGWRQRSLAKVIFSAESYRARALERAAFLHVTGDRGTYDKALGDALAMRMDQITPFARKYFAPERARVLYLDPMPLDKRPAPGAVGLAGKQASVDTSNPAMDGQVKTGHQESVRDW